MKRSVAVACLLGVLAVGGSLWYQTNAREAEYRALVGRGEAALAQQDTFVAIEAFSGAIALHPDSMLPYLRRGETYQLRGDLDGAARDLRQAADLDPSATRPLELLGDVLYQRGRFRQAASAYEGRLALDDVAPAVAYKLALAHYRVGHVEGALAAIERALAADDSLADAYYLRGVCLRDARRLDEAIEALEAAVERSPGFVPAREELADVYAALSRRAEELEQLQIIAALDRQNVDRQVAVGLAHARSARDARTAVSQQRHADLAILTLGSALERAPDHPRIYGALGAVWLDIAEARSDRVALDKAIEALERVAAAPTATSSMLTAYGRALGYSERAEEAERALEQATRRYPVDPAAFLAYAEVAHQRAHVAAARTALVEYGALIRDESDFAGRAQRIASLSLELNEPYVAADWLERALLAAPGDLTLLSSLADAHLRSGNVARARALVEQGLVRDPVHPALLALAGRLSPPV